MDWLNLDTWLISDTHFFHANIVEYCNRPADHTYIMEGNWHRLVAEDAPIFHLGDISLGRREDSEFLLDLLPGKKYMLRGNHDHRSLHWYRERGFTIMGEKLFHTLEDGTRILFSHYPDTTFLADWTINVHGHIHNNGYGGSYPDRDYRNISVEVMDYRPWRLRDIIYRDKYQTREMAGAWTPKENIV